MKNEEKVLIKHIRYNREVVYEKKIEITVSEFEKLIESEFNEKDKEYLEYHNPTLKKVVGEKIHPTAKFEQIFNKKNFYIELI